MTNTAGGSLVLRADNTGTGTGTVKFASYPYSTPGHVDFSGSTGTVSVFYNPAQPLEGPPGQSKYQNPTDFSVPPLAPPAPPAVSSSTRISRRS